MKLNLLTNEKRSSIDIALEESNTWEVINKINISCNGKEWEYDLITCFIVIPPSQTDAEPTLEIVGSYISRDPITALEKIILDCKNANDI